MGSPRAEEGQLLPVPRKRKDRLDTGPVRRVDRFVRSVGEHPVPGGNRGMRIRILHGHDAALAGPANGPGHRAGTARQPLREADHPGRDHRIRRTLLHVLHGGHGRRPGGVFAALRRRGGKRRPGELARASIARPLPRGRAGRQYLRERRGRYARGAGRHHVRRAAVPGMARIHGRLGRRPDGSLHAPCRESRVQAFQ